MTTPPTLRALALDATARALNAGRYWLPADAQAAVVDAVLAVSSQPAEHCGDQLPRIGRDTFTECVLHPGHQGSHADFEGSRWTKKHAAAGYCPHCGRGDAGPTADEHEQLRQRARQNAAASRESERQLQQQIDRQATEIDRLRDALASRPADSCGSCGASPVTYYAPDGLPACADCAPCDCGTEPCSKPDVVARRNAALEPPKEAS